ncbi:MAG: imidazole glycerol phosphate synthase subunit HisH [Desulfobacterota bacterium]|nr:imidazole glycerol phosphate synthase subunit HisH [Thermodesulfobacteriota bacterium]
MIAVVDIGLGNLQSVCWACAHVGAKVCVAAQPSDLKGCSAIILPGVGAFGDGMRQLRQRGFVDALCQAVAWGMPLLGICLGMQLLAEVSEEYGLHPGLGLIKGHVTRLKPSHNGERVPHIGWCDVALTKNESVLFRNIPTGVPFYFAHSYALACSEESDVGARIFFGSRLVTAAIERGNLFGVQFHPEKSQDVGLELLHNFWLFSRQ